MNSAMQRAGLPLFAHAGALFVLLVALGLLGNYAHFAIFLNIDFLFGSIFAMLALQLLGLRCGMLAAAVIGSYTYVLWNHPYAAIVLTAEVGCAGLLWQRYKIGLVLADAIFWIAIGAPATYAAYALLLNVPVDTTLLVMAKQTINGITNALAARLMYCAYVYYQRKSMLALRDVSYNLLTFFALAPALVLIAISSRYDVTEADLHIRQELKNDEQRLQAVLGHWIGERSDVVTVLSQMAASHPAATMQTALDQARQTDANFLRVGLLDASATVLQYSPLVDELGVPVVGKNFSDRPFSSQIRQATKPFLSEVVVSRMGQPEPIVTLLAPVRRDGNYAGYVSGVLSLEHLRNYMGRGLEQKELRYLLVDKHGTVILSNRPEYPTMSHFERPEGHSDNFPEGSYLWTPLLARGQPTMERWKYSWYVTESHMDAPGNWELVLEQPLAPVQTELSRRYARLLFILLLLLLMALALAEWLSRQTIATLEKLSELTHQLPTKLIQGKMPIVWPQTTIAETNNLIENFQVMAASLSEQVSNERRINSMLDAQVSERTAALSESLREKEVLLREVHHRVKNNLQVITSILRLESGRSDHPASIAVLQGMQDRVRSMALLHETIYRNGTFSAIDLGDYLRQVATQAFRALQGSIGNVQLRLDLGTLRLSLDQATPCGLLVNELISNSLKHGFGNGRSGDISIELQPLDEQNRWRLRVYDTGVGLPADFEARCESGLGLKLVAGLAQQIGGHLETGPGAMFTVVFVSLG